MDATTPDRPRGEETREALIAAGLDLFGKLGYHATSSRALASAAGVNQALIGYHFGGKRGLYVAVFEHVARRMEAGLAPATERLDALLDRADELDRELLQATLFAVLDRLVDLFTSPETAPWAALVVREQQQPSEAFEVLWERVMSRMLGRMRRLIGVLTGRAPDSSEVRLLFLTIVGQALIFRVARESALRILGCEAIGPEEIAAIKVRIRANVESILSLETTS